MKSKKSLNSVLSKTQSLQPATREINSRDHSVLGRRSFLRKGLAAGAGTVAFGLLANKAEASGGLTIGDAAILQFLAVLETLETDFWQQYNELGGIQDSEVPGGSGSTAYTAKLAVLDSDMSQYIRLLNGQFPAIPRSDDDTKG